MTGIELPDGLAIGQLGCFRHERITLTHNPYRVGKPLFGPLAGCHGARRGTYRIGYRIDESSKVVHVLDVDH